MDNKGLYFGTEINGKWWQRFAKDGFFMRGNGTYQYDDKGFYFTRYLTKAPLFIPFSAISRIETGTWHAGKWGLSALILKFIWNKDSLNLSSGFIVAKSKKDTLKLKEILEAKIKA